jgi:hypothetical protein
MATYQQYQEGTEGPQKTFLERESDYRRIHGEALIRLGSERQQYSQSLGFDSREIQDQLGGSGKFRSVYDINPRNKAGQLFELEHERGMQAKTAGQIQSGGVGSGGIFNRAAIGVKRAADVGRDELVDLEHKSNVKFVDDRGALAQEMTEFEEGLDIERQLGQETVVHEVEEESDDLEEPAGKELAGKEPAGEVKFRVGKKGTVKTFTSKSKLIAFLKARGVKPAQWAKDHPSEARKLGFNVSGVRSTQAQSSKSGKKLTAKQIRRWNAKHPKSKRFRK